MWDPQASVTAGSSKFSSPDLPAWLAWDCDTLSGEVPESALGTVVEFTAVATVLISGKAHEVVKRCKIKIAGGSHGAST